MSTHKPTIQKGSRFSLLFVRLTFVVALFLGMTLGYGLGRSQSQPRDVVVVTATPADAVAQANNNSTPPSEQSDSAAGPPTPTIMDFVLSDARHFQGNDGSPVTVVEFSDFK
jgi:hypothetical protein